MMIFDVLDILGAKASASHSASLAANDSVCDALLKRNGIIRADNWDDLYLIGNVIKSQPLPKGRRIAVVTDAGGVGVLLADATDSYHMNLANFDPKTKEAFKKVMPPYYICNNPMDLTGSGISPLRFPYCYSLHGRFHQGYQPCS